jgi:hypothetical protein
MAKVTNPGGMQPMSRALRPGTTESGGKKPSFDLGSIKGPKSTMAGGPTKIGKGIKSNPGMKPPSFKGRPNPRGG